MHSGSKVAPVSSVCPCLRIHNRDDVIQICSEAEVAVKNNSHSRICSLFFLEKPALAFSFNCIFIFLVSASRTTRPQTCVAIGSVEKWIRGVES